MVPLILGKPQIECLNSSPEEGSQAQGFRVLQFSMYSLELNIEGLENSM